MATDDAVKLIVAVLAVVILLPFLAMGLFMTGGMVMGPGTYGMGGLAWVFAILPLLILGLFAWLVYRLVLGTDRRDPALRELREAYARGDITTDEFEERKERLGRE
ncbi:MAG: SHOCT domain-containing protein [Halanaeroarchaeum sp.]